MNKRTVVKDQPKSFEPYMLIVVLVNMFFKDRCKLFDFEGRGRSTAEKGT